MAAGRPSSGDRTPSGSEQDTLRAQARRPFFPLAAGLTVCATLAAFFLPARGTVALRALQGEWRQLLTNGPFLRLTLVGFLAFLCLHGPMDVFSHLYPRPRREYRDNPEYVVL